MATTAMGLRVATPFQHSSGSSSNAWTAILPGTPPATERGARGRLIACIKTDALQVVAVVGVAVGEGLVVVGDAAATTRTAATPACKTKRNLSHACKPKRKSTTSTEILRT